MHLHTLQLVYILHLFLLQNVSSKVKQRTPKCVHICKENLSIFMYSMNLNASIETECFNNPLKRAIALFTSDIIGGIADVKP